MPAKSLSAALGSDTKTDLHGAPRVEECMDYSFLMNNAINVGYFHIQLRSSNVAFYAIPTLGF
jgi:hypothetical protein